MLKLKSVISLLITAFILIALLFVTQKYTQKHIDEVLQTEQMSSIKHVFPNFDNNPISEKIQLNESVIYPIKEKSKLKGWAVKTTIKGYANPIDMITGFTHDSIIEKVYILKHKETKGLGARICDTLFINQFNGKAPCARSSKLIKDGGNVDAVSGATFSSRAVCNGIEKSFIAIRKTTINK